MVNLAPTDPSLGVITPPLKSMHNAEGCECENVPVTEVRINHYLGSTEDYLARTKRSWKVWMYAYVWAVSFLTRLLPQHYYGGP